MTKAPILALPNFKNSLLFKLTPRVQERGHSYSNGHPISFFSKKCCPKLLNSYTYVRELHAITSAVQKCCHCLLEKQFTIETDQKSLNELMNISSFKPLINIINCQYFLVMITLFGIN